MSLEPLARLRLHSKHPFLPLLLSCLSMITTTAWADPLQGHIEEKGNARRLKQAVEQEGRSAKQAAAEESSFLQGPLGANTRASRKSPLKAQDSAAQEEYWQEEYWIDWQGWSDRIGQRIWPLLVGKVMPAAGEIRYNVTRDGHIILLSASGSQKTVQLLLSAVLSLQGDPVLQFPAGTQLSQHARITAVQSGLVKEAERQYWGSEHITRQWHAQD